MSYKIKVVQIDYTGQKPAKFLIEEQVNEALKEVSGEVTDIDNWTPDSLRGALVVITYKE